MAFGPTKLLSDLISAQRRLKEIKKKRFKGISKDGKVSVQINGAMEIIDVYIDEALLNPGYKTIVEKDIREAHKEAMKKSADEMRRSITIGDMEILSKIMK
uniref:YbaB/EbfC family DNA-binding protein n=1 Tax=candidate division CPR3 bacterium TaxID=2268181 RepID=A0A7C5YR42_UNCC3